MTSVVVTPIPGADYTWQTATFNWSPGGTALKTWADSWEGDYLVEVDESLNLAEFESKGIQKSISESFGITETSFNKAVVKRIAETLGISETYVDHIGYILRIFEGIGFAEKLGKGSVKSISESLQFVEASRKDFTKQINEVIGFVEAFARVVTYRRLISESFAVSEAVSKAVTIHKNEAFSILDKYLRSGGAVVSDMILGVGDVTLADFNALLDNGHAPGYSAFRDFIQGDYTYKGAIFRAVLESINADRAQLKEFKIDVDVPDVVDSGSGTIVVAGTGLRVNFNRVFNVVPEIVMTLKGGTIVGVPDVIDPDLTGFTGILTDPSGTRITGVFTWYAKGY